MKRIWKWLTTPKEPKEPQRATKDAMRELEKNMEAHTEALRRLQRVVEDIYGKPPARQSRKTEQEKEWL